MDDARHVDRGEPELESDLVDLTGVDLQQLSALPHSVLAMSLRRILAENSVMREYYAGFQDQI
jgi:FXSXX-COOH protein